MAEPTEAIAEPEVDDLVEDELDDDEEQVTEIPVHGVIAPEGRPSGDGRMFAAGALSSRVLPVPLRYEILSSHGGDETSHVVTVGRVDEVFREGDSVRWRGALALNRTHTSEVVEGLIDQTVRGVSLDGDDAVLDFEASSPDDQGDQTVVFKSLRVAGLTIVPIPAFQEAYIAFGHEFQEDLTDAERIEQAEALAACGCADDATFRDVSQEERDRLADDGKAMPDGSYPIANLEDLKNAIQAIGRASDPEAVKRHIKKRARALGHEELIPEDWASGTFDLDGVKGTFDLVEDGADDSAADRSEYTSAIVALVPAKSDPVTAASSEPAHITLVWLGEAADLADPEALAAQVREYAAGAGPIVAPVQERGTLGDDDADVVFLEPTESLVAFRDGLLADGTAVRVAHDAADQFPQWTPHVTLGYPETPANGDYSGTEVTFDRLELWLGGDVESFPLGAAEESEEDPEASPTFAPGTKDGPGWITHPIPTSRIRRYWVRGKGAAKIRWGVPGDFNRCRSQLVKYVQNPEWLAGLCANMHKEALGVWPGQEHSVATVTAAATLNPSRPAVTLVASAQNPFPYEYFQDPSLTGPTPLTVDMKTGRVFGHIAAFGTCHIGIPGVCTTPPHSATDYAMFRSGVVDTTVGEIRVGKLTSGVGHPNPAMRAAAATAHYDKTDAVRAYVNVGEDKHGIWFSGVLAPGLTEEQIDEFRAVGSLSGDWRASGGNLELVAAVAVNTPGFPMPSLAASGGVQTTLIAAGAVAAPEAEETPSAFTAKDVGEIVKEYRRQESIAARALPARETIRRHRLASARARLEPKE